jgi:hypothetical protein
MVAFFSPAILFVRPRTMIAGIQDVGLTSGLKLCLDAGDINSYSGTGQSWLDTSGNGYDFFRGATGASQSSDPTFNGTAGGESSAEYFSFDGGDYLTLAQANPTWVNNLHKNNATFTVIFVIRLTSFGGGSIGPGLMGDYKGDGTPSFDCHVTTAGKLGLEVVRSPTAFAIQTTSTAAMSTNAWTFLGISVNEPAGTGIFQINGTQENFTSTYSSPSSSNAGVTLKLGDYGDTLEPMTSGGRMALAAAWEGVSLSTTQMTALFENVRGRFAI